MNKNNAWPIIQVDIQEYAFNSIPGRANIFPAGFRPSNSICLGDGTMNYFSFRSPRYRWGLTTRMMAFYIIFDLNWMSILD